jgi:hypothetical protein
MIIITCHFEEMFFQTTNILYYVFEIVKPIASIQKSM